MTGNLEPSTKREWSKPRLTVYGNVEKITQGVGCKKFGISDGGWLDIGIANIPIKNCS